MKGNNKMSDEKTTLEEINKTTKQRKSWKKDRPYVVNVQLSQTENDLIANASALSGISKREIVRLLITKNFNGFEFYVKHQKHFAAMLTELRQQGTSLNQMAKLFDSGEQTMLSPSDKAVIDELNDNLLKIAEYLMKILSLKA